MKKYLLPVIAAVVMLVATTVPAAKASGTYCVYSCNQTVQYWCNGGGLWQVTSGDEWLQLQQSFKGCV